MCRTVASILHRNPRSEESKEVHAFERHFIYEHARTSLCEKQKQLGVLRYHAEVFYSSTDNVACEENTQQALRTEVQSNELNEDPSTHIGKETKTVAEDASKWKR